MTHSIKWVLTMVKVEFGYFNDCKLLHNTKHATSLITIESIGYILLDVSKGGWNLSQMERKWHSQAHVCFTTAMRSSHLDPSKSQWHIKSVENSGENNQKGCCVNVKRDRDGVAQMAYQDKPKNENLEGECHGNCGLSFIEYGDTIMQNPTKWIKPDN